MKKTLDEKITRRVEALKKIRSSLISQAVDISVKTIKSGNKIFALGNGGSAAQASHFAAELVNRFYYHRPPVPALSLTSDQANLTSIANDYSFQDIFVRQLAALAVPGDLVIGLSTSGKSANVLKAFEYCCKNSLKSIALCGSNTDLLKQAGADLILNVCSADTPLIQEIHLFFLHLLAEETEKALFPAER